MKMDFEEDSAATEPLGEVASSDLLAVELVGGPKCGAIVKWPKRQNQLSVKYRFGYAIYERESLSKAIYISG